MPPFHNKEVYQGLEYYLLPPPRGSGVRVGGGWGCVCGVWDELGLGGVFVEYGKMN